MSIIKLITTVILAVTLITMITSIQPSIYAVTEDDGWVEGDYEGSLEEQEEQAQEDWEDAGRPGEMDDDDDDDDHDDENDNDNDDGLVECVDGSLVESEELCEQSEALVTCSDGSSAVTLAECPPEPVLSFVTCSDGSSAVTLAECPPEPDGVVEYPDGVVEYPDGVVEYPDGVVGLPPVIPENEVSCPDVPFYMTCHEPEEKENDNDNDNKVIQKTTVIQSATATANANANTNAADISNCKLSGSEDGIQQRFNLVRYQACGLYPNGQIAYGDGFIRGCTQVGNTQQLCQAFVVMNTQQTQIGTQPQTQPNTQSITQPTQAIQPAAVS